MSEMTQKIDGSVHPKNWVSMEVEDYLTKISLGPNDVVIADARVFHPENFQNYKHNYSNPVLLIVPLPGQSLQGSIQSLPRQTLIDMLATLVDTKEAL